MCGSIPLVAENIGENKVHVAAADALVPCILRHQVIAAVTMYEIVSFLYVAPGRFE